MNLEEIYSAARHNTFTEFKNTVNERFGVPPTVESNKEYMLIEVVAKTQEVRDKGGECERCKRHFKWTEKLTKN